MLIILLFLISEFKCFLYNDKYINLSNMILWNAQINNFTLDENDYQYNIYMKKLFFYLENQQLILNSFIKNQNNNTLLLNIGSNDKENLNDNMKDILHLKFGISNFSILLNK